MSASLGGVVESTTIPDRSEGSIVGPSVYKTLIVKDIVPTGPTQDLVFTMQCLPGLSGQTTFLFDFVLLHKQP